MEFWIDGRGNKTTLKPAPSSEHGCSRCGVEFHESRRFLGWRLFGWLSARCSPS